MRKCPSPTGFFKVDNLFGELLTNAQKTIARKNLGIDELPIPEGWGNQDIWVGDDPPSNLEQLWLEPSPDEYLNKEGNLTSIRQSIYILQQQMSKVLQLVQYGVIAGNATSGGRTQIIQEENINPNTGELELIEPTKLTGTVPNLSIKFDTQANFAANKNNLIDGELIWLTDKNSLCIYLNGKFTAISNSSAPNENEMTQEDIEKLYFNSLGLTDINNNKYKLEINENGNIIVYNSEIPLVSDEPAETKSYGSFFNSLLKINSIFIGDTNLDSFAACSHNFVELANASEQDLNLHGLFLLYKRPGESNWEKLALKGKIKAGSTFLIRGARCSYESNLTLNVSTYDMQWYTSRGELITFSAGGGCFYLAQGNQDGKLHNGTSWEDDINGLDPYKEDNSVKGYIDLVGIKSPSETDYSIHGEGNKPIQIKSNESTRTCIFVRSFPLDPCSQAQKDKAKRASSSLWTYVNMETKCTNAYPYYEMEDKYKYVPKSSTEDKNIFGVRTTFSKEVPNMVNVTFGIQATDSGLGATRCFNWVSYGYYDEYIEYKLKTSNTWIKKYSISEDNYTIEYAGDTNISTFINIYNRIKWLSTNKTPVTTHKAIIRNLNAGVYEYRVGRENHLSDIYEFTVRTDSEVNQGFSFVHTSDQQAFNYYEYQAWTKSAWAINENHPNIHFTINTGDITQNGNRESEWLDYYNGRKYLRNKEEMYTIGNNDLCGIIPYELGDGNAATYKINHKNIQYYYTFELDVNNPAVFEYVNPTLKVYGDILEKTEDGFKYYFPSLYSFNYGKYHFISINSEFAENTKNVYSTEAVGLKEHAYYNMYKWVKADLENNVGKNHIAFMHEIPFCIIKIDEQTGNAGDRAINNGSKLNHNFSLGIQYSNQEDTTDYSGGCCFSELFQNNNVGLVLGGHKHTYSLSYPTKEKVDVVNGVRTVDYNNPIIDTTSTSVTAGPIYAMTQATGYKLVSNKELPGSGSKWLRKVFASTVTNGSATANTNQYNPMYSICNIKDNVLNFKSYAINNIYNGKTAFNINNQMVGFETTNISQLKDSDGITNLEVTINYGNS